MYVLEGTLVLDQAKTAAVAAVAAMAAISLAVIVLGVIGAVLVLLGVTAGCAFAHDHHARPLRRGPRRWLSN